MPRIYGAGLSLQRAGGGGIPGGAWVPWDALVSNNPGVGDYTEISTACATEPAGAVIAVDCNSTTPYVEIADIVLKEGQYLFAYDGVRQTGTVCVLMGDFQVLMPNANGTIKGIYFWWDNMTAASIGEYKLDIAGTGAFIDRCVFNIDNNTAGVPLAARGVRIQASNVTLRNVTQIGNDFLRRPLLVSGAANLRIEDCSFSGSSAGVAAEMGCQINNATSCIFQNTSFTTAGDVGGALAEAGACDRNTYINCTVRETTMLGNGFVSLGTHNKIIGMYVYAGATGGISIQGTNTMVDDCLVYVNGTGCIGVLANDVSVTNCMEDPSGTSTNFLAVGALGPGGSRRVSFVNCHGTGGFSVNDSHYISFFGCSTLGNIAVNSSGLVNFCTHVTFVGCFSQGTFNSGGVGSRFIVDINSLFFGGIAGQNFQRGVVSHVAAIAPTVSDDISRGYVAGVSRWYLTGSNIFYECKDDTFGAAVWAPAGVLGGACPWNVLVHPTVGYGNYTTINQACSGSGNGAVIAVCPGTYAEGLDITLKEGQIVFALGGIEGDDVVSVVAGLTGGVRVRMPNDDAQIRGIYFKYTALVPAEDHEVVRITGNNVVFENCTIDTTPSGAQAHRALYISTCSRVRVDNLSIVCDPLCYRPVEVDTVNDSIIRNLNVTGGNTNAGALTFVLVTNSQRNSWENIRIYNLSSTVAAGTIFGIILGGNYDPDHFLNVYIELGVIAASGAAITYNGGAAPRDKGDEWSGLTIDGSYNGVILARVDNVKFMNGSIGVVSGNFVGNDCFQLNDSSLILISGCELYATAGRCLVTVAGTTFSNSLKIVDSDLATAAATAILSSFADSFWNITDCLIVGDVNYAGGGGYLHITGIQLLGTLNCSGALTTDVMVDNSYIFAAQIDIARSRFSNCYIFNILIGVLGTANDTFITGCSVFGTLTNSGGANRTTIGNCIIGTFLDTGDDTIRDVLTQQTIAGGAANIRGSREYDNRGAGAPLTLTLPDPNAVGVQVSVGYRFRITVIAAQLITIAQPALQTIYGNGFNSTTGVLGNINSNVPWSVIELEYKGSNDWVAVSALGTWNFV